MKKDYPVYKRMTMSDGELFFLTTMCRILKETENSYKIKCLGKAWQEGNRIKWIRKKHIKFWSTDQIRRKFSREKPLKY